MRKPGKRRWKVVLAVLAACQTVAPAAAQAPRKPSASATTTRLQQEIRDFSKGDWTKDPAATLAHADKLLVRARADRSLDPMDLVALEREHAVALFYLKRYEESLEEQKRIIARLQSLGHDERLPLYREMKEDYATMMTNVGRLDEAEDILEAMLAYLERNDIRSAERVSVLYKLSSIANQRGESLEAERRVSQVVAMSADMPDLADAQKAIYRISWVRALRNLGRADQALQEAEKTSAWTLTHLGQDHRMTIEAMRTYALVLGDAGKLGKAMEVYATIEDYYSRKKITDDDYAAMLMSYAAVLSAHGRTDTAGTLYRRAYALVPARKPMSNAGIYLYSIAQQTWRLGDPARALADARTSFELNRDNLGEQHVETGRSRLLYGRLLAADGQLPAAREAIEGALRTVMAKRGYYAWESVLARASLRTLDAREGRAVDAAAVNDDLDNVTRRIYTLGNRHVALSATARAYQDYFDELLRIGEAQANPQWLFAAVQLRMLNDLDSAGAAYLARASGGDAAFAATLREAQDASAAIDKLKLQRVDAVNAGDPQALATLDATMREQQTRMESLYAKLEAGAQGDQTWLQPQPETLAAVQRRLQADEGLLINLPLGPSELFNLYITPAGVRWARQATSIPLATLAERVRAGIDAQLTGQGEWFDVAAARALHAAVMPPALDGAIARAGRLHVANAGVLGSVPYAVLVTSGRGGERVQGEALRKVAWLAQRQALSTPVSLRMLALPKSTGRRGTGFAGIGAPALEGQPMLAMRGLAGLLRTGTLDAKSVRALPPLPQTADELQRMRAAIGGGGLLLTGDQATEQALRQTDLSRYGVIAFATHGLVSGGMRGLGEPGLVMTPAGNDDGVFTASDVARLRLNADWVILSACDTAAGDTEGAAMYSGLARAFVYAGTQSLLLSHWPVRDDVAARLSVETVQGAQRGIDRAQALRQAQLRLIRDRSVPAAAHPATWAPFMLLGD